MSDQHHYISITEVHTLINTVLKEGVPQVLFEGEISQLTRAASGHLYFTLKDNKSQLSAVMWKGTTASLSFEPEPGMSVLCHGRPNVYNVSGRLQVVVHRMLLAGEGLLQQKYLELKAKLENEGLFDPSRKRTLPFLPRAVGVVTSKTGAVIHDIMTKIRERMPSMQVYLIDVRVQGEGAAQEIADAISLFNRLDVVDVLIVGRGGGSLEDLWAFNEEIVARAVYASRLPVISGVGHEVDVALSDLVADVRAPTPTAAGEMVVPRRDDLLSQIDDLETRLSDLEEWFMPLGQQVDELELRLKELTGRKLENAYLELRAYQARVEGLRPQRLLETLRARVDGVSGELGRVVRASITSRQDALASCSLRLERCSPMRMFEVAREKTDHTQHRLEKATGRYFERQAELLRSYEKRLSSINPKQVLQRGFALVKDGSRFIRSVDQIKENRELSLSLVDGTVETSVISKRKEDTW